MGVGSVNAGSATAQAAAASSSSAQASSGSTSSTSSSKKDTAIISQKARDLAAMKNGKSSQEEMSESVAAKMKEGPNS